MNRVILRIEEALERLKMFKNMNFYKDLEKHPNKKDWLVEGDVPKEDGSQSFFIIPDTEENRKILIQHTPTDLNS